MPQAFDNFNKPFPTVLLLHTLNGNAHYDWLVTNPLKPGGRLWTGRIDYPSELWAKLDRCEIEVIAPHRRKYLNYEGEISKNRGVVKRVDEGEVSCKTWGDKKIVLQVNMSFFIGQAQINYLDNNIWQVSFMAD